MWLDLRKDISEMFGRFGACFGLRSRDAWGERSDWYGFHISAVGLQREDPETRRYRQSGPVYAAKRKAWRNSPDQKQKAKAYRSEYEARNAEAIRQRRAEHYRANRERLIAKAREYRKADKS